MNEDGTPIEQQQQQPKPGEAGHAEGRAPEPASDDVQKMYDELGIKATAPNSKSTKRPKAANVRDKDVSKNDAGNSDDGRKKHDDGKGKPKNAPDSDKDGASGDDADAKGAKKREEDGKVRGESEEADEGVRKDKSRTEEDSERGSEEGAESGNNGDGQEEDESGASEEEGKRPGKSNPKIEQRFQKLIQEVKERDEVIEELQRKLQEATTQQRQAQIDQEDPEYTVEDFKKVRDEQGNILDLDDDQAELAFRRWQDGYNQRKAERDARLNRDQALQEAQQKYQQEQMQKSVEAYDTLTGLVDSFPELDVRSDKFDQELSDAVMPIIEEVIIYQEGTEPGNPDGNQPIIAGMSMNPKRMLEVINKIKNAKRTLPLNGINDTVESRSNVNVPHSRSSDPVVNQANELYKTLGIDKRI